MNQVWVGSTPTDHLMKIIAISDLHGTLPDVEECDLLLIAGDICPKDNHSIDFQWDWLDRYFRLWLEDTALVAKKIVGIAGNHDFVFQVAPDKVPALPWTYLQDQAIEFDGLVIWGTPWQPYFFDWAFNLYEADLAKKWSLIPDETDILVLHGPPYGYGDMAPRADEPGYEHTGSPSLLKRIDEVKPRLVVFGHIHEGRGEWKHGESQLANVTIVDEKYNHVHPNWEYELTR